MEGQDRAPDTPPVVPPAARPQTGVCSRELACEEPSSTYPDGKLSLREEQPGALGIRLLYQRGVQVQGQGRLGVFCCALKQEAVTVTPLPPPFPRPLQLGQSLPRAPRPLGQSLGQTQRLAGSVIRKLTSFKTPLRGANDSTDSVPALSKEAHVARSLLAASVPEPRSTAFRNLSLLFSWGGKGRRSKQRDLKGGNVGSVEDTRVRSEVQMALKQPRHPSALSSLLNSTVFALTRQNPMFI